MDTQGYREWLGSVGSQIQTVRMSAGLTQEEAAERVGVTRVTVGYIEQGRRAPSLKRLFDLAQAYDVEVYQFFWSDESPNSAVPAGHAHLAPGSSELDDNTLVNPADMNGGKNTESDS